MHKMFIFFGALMLFLVGSTWANEPDWPKERLVLDWQSEHAHASSLVELPNGDLLAC